MKNAPENQKINESADQRHHITKEAAILKILHERSLNTFEAITFGDSCLHSTVSTLRAKGHVIHDHWEWVRNRFGSETHVKRYLLIKSANGRSQISVEAKQ